MSVQYCSHAWSGLLIGRYANKQRILAGAKAGGAFLFQEPVRELGGIAHGACEARSRREEEAMSVQIVVDEQRRDRPQSPCALLYLNKWYGTGTNVLRQYTIPLLEGSQLKHQGIVCNC